VGAATCFGLTSGTVRAVWLGHATPAAVAAGLTSAGIGVALAQQAYRDGGLGAPLATLTLVDPLSAGALGVLILGETLNLTPTRLALAVCGGVATVVGVVLLSQRQPSARTARPLPSTARECPPDTTRADIINRGHLLTPPVTDQPGAAAAPAAGPPGADDAGRCEGAGDHRAGGGTHHHGPHSAREVAPG
jgi:hypothetical protein